MANKVFKHWPTLLLGVFVAAVLLVAVFTYQVETTEVAVIEVMGRTLNEHPAPGLHFRWPYPFQKITTYDNRLHCFSGREGQIEETATANKQNILVGVFITYKIGDPILFFQRMTTFEKAENELDIWMRGAKNAAFGKFGLDQILTTDPQKMVLDKITTQIRKEMEEKAAPYGLEIRSAGITTLNVPEAVSSKVFERMNQDRLLAAQRYIGEGRLKAEEIRIGADKERANIIANAEAQAKEISAQGDVEAAKYLKVFEKNPELAAFLRKLDSLRTIMKTKTTLVLDTDTDPFTLLKSNADQLSAPAKH